MLAMRVRDDIQTQRYTQHTDTLCTKGEHIVCVHRTVSHTMVTESPHTFYVSLPPILSQFSIFPISQYRSTHDCTM